MSNPGIVLAVQFSKSHLRQRCAVPYPNVGIADEILFVSDRSHYTLTPLSF